MIIYDHNKEFIGIDEESLKLLGYERFEDLIHEHRDVAELFVKKPGYIHNFTNFPWIDFVLHAESEVAKVIIAGKNKAFSATLDIAKLHLTKAPAEEGYLIRLKNVQPYKLDASERAEPTPPPFNLEAKPFNARQETSQPAVPPAHAEQPKQQAAPTMDEGSFIREEQAVPEEAGTPLSSPTAADDELDIFFHDDEELPIAPEPELPPLPKSVLDNLKEEKRTPMLGASLSEQDKAYLEDLQFSDDYTYDPNIAADELGLPVDLIEEFIGDFIKQAHEFKEQFFDAVKKEDFDAIKVLSHKLKGVAANLRIEDSFEVLRNLNESSDIKECEANLKRFYLTVAKLEGKDIEEVRLALDNPVEPEELYTLTPKFNEPYLEEELMAPLDLPELESQADLPPVMQEGVSQPVATEEIKEETTDIYDFGLNQADSDNPFMVMEDEEEISSTLQDFEPQADSDNPLMVKEDEEEISSTLQDFEPQADSDNPFMVKEDEEAISSTLQDFEPQAESTTPLLTYDVNLAAAEIGLKADLVAALIDDYIVEADEMKSKLDDAISKGDVVRWKGYATQLKGISDNLRINDVSNTLQNLIGSSEKQQAKAAMQEFYGFTNQL